MKSSDRKVELKILALDKGINNNKLIGNKITRKNLTKAMIHGFVGVRESLSGSRN